MARSKKPKYPKPAGERREIPPGATQRASDADLRPGEPPSSLGDRHAAGTTGGGSEVGGLAGSNVGDGAPDNVDLEAPAATGIEQENLDEEDARAYSGISGGAVGGTPAQGRSSGGYEGNKLRPGGVHRGDSTIGSDPNSGSA